MLCASTISARAYFAPTNRFMGEMVCRRILDDVSGIHVPEPRQIAAQTDVHNIIFAQGAQMLPALDIEALDPVKNIGIQQCAYIGLNGVNREISLAALVQQLFVYEGIADGCDGGAVPILLAGNMMIFRGRSGSVICRWPRRRSRSRISRTTAVE